MKVLLALAVLATSASAISADSREIFDIMYLPNSGTTYGISEFTYLNGEIKFPDGKIELSGPVLSQTLGHSFTDRFSLSASIGHENIESKSKPEGGPTTTSTQSGLSDPSVTARFRAMDESFRFDIFGGAKFGIMDSEEKKNEDKTVATGGSSLFVGSQTGGKSEGFQWALLGELTHNLESETHYEDGDIDVKNDAHNELGIRLEILNKLGEKSFLRSNVASRFVEGFKDNQDPKEETLGQTLYTVGTQYQHLISSDLLLKAGVDYNKINYSTGQVDNYRYWTMTVGANYQF